MRHVQVRGVRNMLLADDVSLSTLGIAAACLLLLIAGLVFARRERRPAKPLESDSSGAVVFHEGPTALQEAYERLRRVEGLRIVRAIWNANYVDAPDYFERESGWLQEHPGVTVERVVNPAYVTAESLKALLNLE